MQSAKKFSPVHQRAQEMGAQFVELGGWQVPQVFSSVDDETANAKKGVALVDDSASGKILVEGKSADPILQGVKGLPSLAIGQGANAGSYGSLYRLRGDLFFFHTSPGLEGTAIQKIEEAIRSSAMEVSLTDITHGWADLLLIGPFSSTLLSRLCGLDFHPEQFPNRTAKQSSVAKTRQLILRRDLGEHLAFSLIGDRSLADYLWQTIFEAGQDLDLVPMGHTAMQTLGNAD